MWLLALFVAVPLIEIALFIQIGGLIGLWPTLLVVVVTAFIGTYLVRSQGAAEMSRLRRSFNELSDPSEPLAHGAMILFSGALLLTPGFFTDAVGFALLVPSVRKVLMREIGKRVNVQRFEMGGGPGASGFEGQRRDPRRPDDRVIDGDYEDVTGEPRSSQGPSGWTRH